MKTHKHHTTPKLSFSPRDSQIWIWESDSTMITYFADYRSQITVHYFFYHEGRVKLEIIKFFFFHFFYWLLITDYFFSAVSVLSFILYPWMFSWTLIIPCWVLNVHLFVLCFILSLEYWIFHVRWTSSLVWNWMLISSYPHPLNLPSQFQILLPKINVSDPQTKGTATRIIMYQNSPICFTSHPKYSNIMNPLIKKATIAIRIRFSINFPFK